MKLYHIKPDSGVISWLTNIGDQKIHGEVSASEGFIISELNKVVGGKITLDLSTIHVTDSSFSKSQREQFEKHLHNSPLIAKQDKPLADYKLDRVIRREEDDQIKGILTVGQQAFGVDVFAKFEILDDTQLKLKGKTHVGKSNPVLLQKLEQSYQDATETAQSIEVLSIEFDLIAAAG